MLEIGIFRPDMTPIDALSAGEVGYVATGLKVVRDCQVGDTMTLADAARRRSRCPATGRPSRWSSPASIPVDQRGLPDAARRAGALAAQRCLADL